MINILSKEVKILKWDKQKCGECGRQVVTLYKKDDIWLCYWCNKKLERISDTNSQDK